MGIEADKIDEIITAHSETVEALKEQRDGFKDKAKKYDGVQKELDDLKKSIEKDGENPFETKYNDLKKEFEDYKAGQEAKDATTKKESAYRSLLKDAGVSEKRIDTILKVSKLEEYELDKDGKFKNADKLTEGIKSEWADFIVDEHEKGAPTPTPPNGSNGKGTAYKSKAEIMAIKDGTERRKAIAENPALFGLKFES
jgi:hypothetical protein